MQDPFVDYTRPVVISDRTSFRNRAFASRSLKFPILGQVRDVDGIAWDIRDVRLGKHGFDLYFGTPAECHGAFKGGFGRLIDTQALYDFWDQNRTRGHGFLFDLPAGRTTLKRARRRLGFNFDNDVAEFWSERLEDLKTMHTREFAAKHGVANHGLTHWVVSDRGKKLVGPQARPLGW